MLVEPTMPDVLHIARNMRSIDRKEVFAMRWSDSNEALADTVLQTRGKLRWLAKSHEGEPVYVFGVLPCWPGKWELWGFGTDKWPLVQFGVTKFIKRNMLANLRAGMGHRIDCLSLVEKTEGHKWLKFLGADDSFPVLKGYGRNGEDFKLFTWR